MADEHLFKHGHEEVIHSQKAQERVGTDWDKIEQQRAEIKALHEKKRILKEMDDDEAAYIDDTKEKIEESHNKWKDTHEQNAKVLKADTSKWDNDWDTINKQREEIKAIKEKQRLSKLNKEMSGMLEIDDETQEKIEKSHNKWKDTHEQNAKVIKADNSKWDNDWDTINKKREEIKKIKEKQRIARLEAEENGRTTPIKDEETKKKIEKSHNKWKDSHAQKAKVIKADNSKWDNDWDTINKKREEIKAIKEKKRLSKLAKESELTQRNKAKKETQKKFKNAHETAPKRMAAKERVGTDWDKINKKREEIKAIKEKKRREKLEKQNELKKRNSMRTDKIYKDPHAKNAKVIKAKERVGNDWNKIEKQRAEIKALKEKKRREKAERQAAEAEAQSERERVRSSSKGSKKKKKQSSSKTKKKKKKRKESSSSSDGEEVVSANETTFGNPHEKNNKVIKANTKNWDNDWDTINKKREEIKAIKEKKRLSKLTKENELTQRNKAKKETEKKFKNAHETAPKRMAAKERVGTDWDKINKKREEIKAIKERKRREKLEKENELKKRNSMRTDKIYKNAHDKKPKKMAAKERVGTDWDKIEKQRAEIRALKEKRRLEKEMGSPVIKTSKNTFGNPHEQ